MDPITVLGAAGSVVGIAGFGLQLAQFLDRFISEYSSADQSYHDILDSIDATSEALEQVGRFLEDEKINVEKGGKLKLFSIEALIKIEKTAGKCLKIFWRIEATILNKESSDLEAKISKNLTNFYESLRIKKEAPILKLDRGLKLSRLQRLKWSFSVGDKLEKYNIRLERLKSALILMFSVISIRVNLTKPNPGSDEFRLLAQIYSDIPQMVARSGLLEAKLDAPHSYPHIPPRPGLRDKGNRGPAPVVIDYTHLRPDPRFSESRTNRFRDHMPLLSTSPPRGRPRRRYNQVRSNDLPGQNQSDLDDRAAVRRARNRKLSNSSLEETDAQSDTALRHKIRVAENSIAKNHVVGEKKFESAWSRETPGPSSKPDISFGEPRLTRSPVSLDEENISILPQRGSVLESSIVKDTKQGSTSKRPVQYQKPSVSERLAETLEEKKDQVQFNIPASENLQFSIDPASEDLLPIQMQQEALPSQLKATAKASVTGEESYTGQKLMPSRKRSKRRSNFPLNVAETEDTLCSRTSTVAPTLAVGNSVSLVDPSMFADENGLRQREQISKDKAVTIQTIRTVEKIPVYNMTLQSTKAMSNFQPSPIRSASVITTNGRDSLSQPRNQDLTAVWIPRDSEEAQFWIQSQNTISTESATGNVNNPAILEKTSKASMTSELENKPEDPMNAASDIRQHLPKQPKINSEIGGKEGDALRPNSKNEDWAPEQQTSIDSPRHVSCPEAPPQPDTKPDVNENAPFSTSSPELDFRPESKTSQLNEGQTFNSPSSGRVKAEKYQNQVNNSDTMAQVRQVLPPEFNRLSSNPVAGKAPLKENSMAPQVLRETEALDERGQTNSRIGPGSDKTATVLLPRNAHLRNSVSSTSLASTNPNPSHQTFSYEGASYESSTSEGKSRREAVYAVLKRMTRRDFMTEDDMETIFPVPGCFITAFVIKGECYHQIPYAGQFSLRKSHIRNLHLSTWWKEIAFLTPQEIASLSDIVADGEDYFKSLVRLQWLRKEKLKFWAKDQRVLVAVVKNQPLEPAQDRTTLRPSESKEQKIARPPSSTINNLATSGLPVLGTVKASSTHAKQDTPESKDTKKEFIIYMAYTIRILEPYSLYGDPRVVEPTITKEAFPEWSILQRIAELDKQGYPRLIDKKLNLLLVQQEQIAKLLEDVSLTDHDPGFAWSLAQIDNTGNSSQGLRSITVYLRKISTAAPKMHSHEMSSKPDKVPILTHVDPGPVPEAPKEGIREPPKSTLRAHTVTFRKRDSEISSRNPPPTRHYDDGSGSSLSSDTDESNISAAEDPVTASANSRRSKRRPTRKASYNRSPDSRFQGNSTASDYAPQPTYPPFPGMSPSPSPFAPIPQYAPYLYPTQEPPIYEGYAPPYPPYGMNYGNPSSPYYPAYDPPSGPPVPSAPPPPAEESFKPPSKPESRHQIPTRRESTREKYPSRFSTLPSEQGFPDKYSTASQPALASRSAWSTYSTPRPQSIYGTASFQYPSIGEPTAQPSRYAPSASAVPLRRYPEYYDGRSFNPLAPLSSDGNDENADIVQKLLMEWTPAGEELKAQKKGKKEEEKEKRKTKGSSRQATVDDDTT